jgi:hypothetical protein
MAGWRSAPGQAVRCLQCECSIAVLLCFLVAFTDPAHAVIQCPTPSEPADAFICTAAMADQLKFTAPSLWYTLSPGAVASSRTAEYPMKWVNEKARCCRHCVWSTLYPQVDPLVLASDRTQTNTSTHLDCNKYVMDFFMLDKSQDQRLSFEEMDPYLSRGVNQYLVGKDRLNKVILTSLQNPSVERRPLTHALLILLNHHLYLQATAFRFADFNRDGYLSLEEYLVFRHFWAPVHLAQVGPQPENEAVLLKDGPLGGLFWDKNVVEVMMVNVINIILEQVEVSKTWACGCTGGVVCPSSCPWNSGNARESNEQEMLKILRTLDLDGSSRVSIEEHYFVNFADRNGDGTVSKEEYYLSLYPTTLQDGTRDTPQTSYNFGKHDLNNDGKITFLERKFTLADRSKDGMLTEAEWLEADLPDYFGPFDGHKTTSTGVVDELRYNYYSVLHDCALEGVRTYQVGIDEMPLASFCSVRTKAQSTGPWIDNSDIALGVRRNIENARVPATRTLSEVNAARSYSTNTRRSTATSTSFMRSMYGEVVKRLRWKTDIVNVARSEDHKISNLQPPPITGDMHLTLNAGLFAGWQGLITDDYACSRSFAPDLDGFVVVVLSDRAEVSLTEAVFRMVASSVFCNFSCFLFISLIVIGHVFWFLERKENSEQFDPSYARGVLDGAWFCIVTMSTVGYGDKSPATGAGKGLTVFWMLFGIINFGLFTGEISNQVGILQAQGRIEGVNDLATFKTGILNSTSVLSLENEYLFEPVTCEDVPGCLDLLSSKTVPALLVPQVDVLTYFLEARLATQKCGNPYRIAGKPVLASEYPSARLCTFRRSVYAGRYIVDGVNAQLDELDADGTTKMFKDELVEQVSEYGEGEGCVPPSELELVLVVPSGVIILLYWALIFYMNRRKTNLTGKLMRDMFRSSQRSPEQIALEFGLRWREKARRNVQIRANGGKARLPPPQFAATLDDRLLIFLKRVRLLSSGQVTPFPPFRTKWTRRVHPSVLTGHDSPRLRATTFGAAPTMPKLSPTCTHSQTRHSL